MNKLLYVVPVALAAGGLYGMSFIFPPWYTHFVLPVLSVLGLAALAIYSTEQFGPLWMYGTYNTYPGWMRWTARVAHMLLLVGVMALLFQLFFPIILEAALTKPNPLNWPYTKIAALGGIAYAILAGLIVCWPLAWLLECALRRAYNPD